MGLDNGILLVVNGEFDFSQVPYYVKLTENDELETRDGLLTIIDVCFWRKCWNFRNKVVNILDKVDDTEDFEVFEYNIPDFVEIIKDYFDDPTEWDSDSFTCFGDMIPQLAQDIINLKWLREYLKSHPQDRAIFYDSY